MEKCAVLNAKMCSIQICSVLSSVNKTNGTRTLFEAVGKIMQCYMALSYDVPLGHIMSHIVVFDMEHPRRKSENTNYLTQLS